MLKQSIVFCAFCAAASGMTAQQLNLNEITHTNANLQSGLGAPPSAAEVIQTQGDFAATGNSLDLAIQGAGFFQVLLPNGQTGYTRTGSFHPDAQGTMVTADGNALQPTVTIPSDAVSITIDGDGTVSVTQPGQTAATQVGEIQTALFVNPECLNSLGNNTFAASIASGNPVVGTPAVQKVLAQYSRACWNNPTLVYRGPICGDDPCKGLTN